VLEVFLRAAIEPDQDWLDFLNTLSEQAALAIDNHELFDGMQRSNDELRLAYDTTIEGWSHALDLRDRETEGHTQRVKEMTLKLAHAAGIPDEQIIQIQRGILLHDIGKLGVPDDILLKPGALTDEEWVIMRQHPVYAHELISPIEFLRPALASRSHWPRACSVLWMCGMHFLPTVPTARNGQRRRSQITFAPCQVRILILMPLNCSLMFWANSCEREEIKHKGTKDTKKKRKTKNAKIKTC
jgi:hypothetical protein